MTSQSHSADHQRRQLVSRLFEFGRWLIEPEILPRPSECPPTQPRTKAALEWLRSSDRLPHTGTPARSAHGILRWLVDRDDLPATQAAEPAHRFSIHWLLSTEPLARMNDFDSTKEVPPHGP